MMPDLRRVGLLRASQNVGKPCLELVVEAHLLNQCLNSPDQRLLTEIIMDKATMKKMSRTIRNLQGSAPDLINALQPEEMVNAHHIRWTPVLRRVEANHLLRNDRIKMTLGVEMTS